MKKVLATALACILLFSLAACGGGGATSSVASGSEPAQPAASSEAASEASGGEEATGELRPLRIACMPHNHGLPVYIAQQEGLFEEAGIDAEVQIYNSGPPMNEALGAGEWDVGIIGPVPAIAGGVAYDTNLIAFAADDTMAVNYWVRPDSEIASINGQVADSPDILGDADSWRGKTILCPLATGAHFMLVATLNKLGLTEDDVDIIPMDVPQAFTAFKSGQGDIVALWDPQSTAAKDEGWVMVSSGPASGQEMYIVIVASEDAMQNQQAELKDFLKVFYGVTETYKDDKESYFNYLKEFQTENGLDVTDEMVQKVVDERPLPTLEDQKELWAGEPGSRKADIIMNNIMDYFIGQGSYEPEDKEYLDGRGFMDGEIINQLIAG